MSTLCIDAGRQDKLRPGDVLGALTGDAGIAADAVGKIGIFATRCLCRHPPRPGGDGLEATALGQDQGPQLSRPRHRLIARE